MFGGFLTNRSLAVCMLAFMAVAARADVIYDGFAVTPGLTINGNATTTVTPDGTVLRLTRAMEFEAGSAFSTLPVSTAQFSSVFSFRVTSPGGIITGGNTSSGADGLVFVLQNVADNVGISGGGMGFRGIEPSLGVEFDTWQNSAWNDPSPSHIGIDLSGSVLHDVSNGPTANISSPELGDGDRWWSWVLYDGIALKVYLDQSESITEPPIPSMPLLTYNINLKDLLGLDVAFAGFTSATGSAWENHDVIYWRYAESIPEPATLSMLVIAGAALLRRRRCQSH